MDRNRPLILGNSASVKRLTDAMERNESESIIVRATGIPIFVNALIPDNRLYLRGAYGTWSVLKLDNTPDPVKAES